MVSLSVWTLTESMLLIANRDIHIPSDVNAIELLNEHVDLN